MRWWFLTLGACGFSGSGMSAEPDALLIDAPIIDAPIIDAPPGTPDAPLDAVVPDAPPADGCRVWATNFDTDPTQTIGASGAVEWKMRENQLLPGVLESGVWRVPASAGALDTTPNDNFEGITTVDVEMRDPSNGTGEGATLWVDPGGSDGTIAQIVVALRRSGTEQIMSLLLKPDGQTLVEAFKATGLSEGFQRIHLVVDKPAGKVRHSINGGSVVETAFTETTVTDQGRFATLFPYSSEAEYTYVRVESCPP